MPKRQTKKKRTPKASSFYDSGKLKKKTCPKCGNGVFMAAHKDRDYCGKCHYMEKKSVEKKEAPKEDKAKKEDKPKKK